VPPRATTAETVARVLRIAAGSPRTYAGLEDSAPKRSDTSEILLRCPACRLGAAFGNRHNWLCAATTVDRRLRRGTASHQRTLLAFKALAVARDLFACWHVACDGVLTSVEKHPKEKSHATRDFGRRTGLRI
jgi:hypothetical protein